MRVDANHIDLLVAALSSLQSACDKPAKFTAVTFCVF